MKKLPQKLAAAAAACLLAGSAFADIGTASVNDVTLNGSVADAFAYQAGWNPQAGPTGDTSGFGTTFDSFGIGPWDLLGKKDGSSTFSNTGQLTFTLTGSGTSGTWTVTNTSATLNAQLDLVFALHAGNQGGAWLFDNQAIAAGQTLNGTWAINWTVGQNGTNHPDFSNATIFGRDLGTTPVPEPATYGMLLAGLGLVGAIARRRRGA
jgi:hypothetical protein